RTDRIRLLDTPQPLTQCNLPMQILGRTQLAYRQIQMTTFAKASDQLEIDFTPTRNRLAINGDNFLIRYQPGLCRKTTALDGTDHRPHLLATKHREQPEEQQGKHEVGERSGGNDRETLTYRLAIERI